MAQTTASNGLAGADLARSYLKGFACPDCGGTGVVEVGRVRVAHSVSCYGAQWLRARHPGLAYVRV